MDLQKLQYVTIITSRGNSNVTCINVHPIRILKIKERKWLDELLKSFTPKADTNN